MRRATLHCGAQLIFAALIVPCCTCTAQDTATAIPAPGVVSAATHRAAPVAPVNQKYSTFHVTPPDQAGRPPADVAVASAQPPGARVRYAREAATLVPAELLASGKVATVSNGVVTPVDAASVEVALDRGQPLVFQRRTRADTITLSPTADRPAGRTVVRLAHEIIVPKADGSGALKTDVLIENLTGLVYRPHDGMYSAALQVALSSGNEPVGTRLATPVKFLVQAVRALSIDPSSLVSDRLWDWQPVTIRTIDPGDRFLVRVSTGGASEGSELELPIVRPTVRVVASPARTVGWGIGTSQVTVYSEVLAGHPVVLSASPGELKPSAVPLDSNGVGIATLRSQGTGIVKITAPNYALDVETVTFTSPIPFVLLGAGGGMAGASLGRKRSQRWIKVLSLGGLTGLLMVTAYFVGLNWLGARWPGIATAGEAVVAVLGAVGALVGVKRLSN